MKSFIHEQYKSDRIQLKDVSIPRETINSEHGQKTKACIDAVLLCQ